MCSISFILWNFFCILLRSEKHTRLQTTIFSIWAHISRAWLERGTFSFFCVTIAISIWAYFGIVPPLPWWVKRLTSGRGSSPQVTFILCSYTSGGVCWMLLAHFSFPVSAKVGRPEEQLENSVMWERRVFRTFVLIQFEREPDGCGAYLTSYCLSLQNTLQVH